MGHSRAVGRDSRRGRPYEIVVSVLLAAFVLVTPGGGAGSRSSAGPGAPSPGPRIISSTGASPKLLTASPALTWFNLTAAVGPSAREDPAIAYDPADRYTVLFGGGVHRDAVSYSDTWTFSAGRWTQRFADPAPEGRLGAGMVYDAHDGYLVLFGGYNESSGEFLNDTWEYSAGHWKELSPAKAPSPRWLFGMDYDPGLQQVVLFGGGDFGPLGDTWTFSNGTWQELSTTPSPPDRSDTSMAYDPADNESMLYGGSANASILADTWAFSAGRWRDLRPVPSPPGGTDLGLAYDPPAEAVILSSGGLNSSSTTPVTWAFAHGAWANWSGQLRAVYPYRNHQSLLWDGADGYLLQFGGVTATQVFNDSWGFDFLNVSAATSELVGEVPFGVTVSALVDGGSSPVQINWTRTSSGGNETLLAANGTLPIPSAGAFELTLRVDDFNGLSVSEGPFEGRGIAPVSLSASSNVTSGVAPLSVDFTSTAAQGVPPYAYSWSFGDGSNGTGATTSHTYSHAGTYEAAAEVVDADQRTSEVRLNITVQAPTPPPSVSPPGAQGPLTLDEAIALLAVIGAGVVAGAIVLWRRRRADPVA